MSPTVDIQSEYLRSEMFVFSSDYEGFGLPILEAQKAGCPVIAQRASSIPEVIGNSGWLVEHDTPARMAAEMADMVRQLLSRPNNDIIEAGFEQNFKITPEQLEAAITPATRMLILCSPSNPTGSVYSKEELRALAQVVLEHDRALRHGGVLFSFQKDH